MKLIQYKINRYGKEPLIGVLLHEGRQWIALKYIFRDYELDGICFVNKHFIKELREIDTESMIGKNPLNYVDMVTKIILLKYTDYEKDRDFVSNLNIDDYQDLFNCLKSLGQLIEIGLHKSETFSVGVIRDILEKSFTINSIDPDVNDEGKRRIEYSKVRYIKINTDYLESLNLYIKWKEKEFLTNNGTDL